MSNSQVKVATLTIGPIFGHSVYSIYICVSAH